MAALLPSDNAGLPETKLMLAILQAADVTSIFLHTGLFSIGNVYRVSFYQHSATLPVGFQAAAGEKYWFGLLGIPNDYYLAFAWSGAMGGDKPDNSGNAGRRDVGDVDRCARS